MLCIFLLNLRWRIERELMKWKISAIYLHLSYICCSFIHWILTISLDLLESCVFIQLCSLMFFSFSAYAEVWRVRLNWMLQRHLSLAWKSHIWFHSLTLCELDLSVDLVLRSWITYILLSFEHLIAFDSIWWVLIISLSFLIMINFSALLMILNKAMNQYIFESI